MHQTHDEARHDGQPSDAGNLVLVDFLRQVQVRVAGEADVPAAGQDQDQRHDAGDCERYCGAVQDGCEGDWRCHVERGHMGRTVSIVGWDREAERPTQTHSSAQVGAAVGPASQRSGPSDKRKNVFRRPTHSVAWASKRLGAGAAVRLRRRERAVSGLIPAGVRSGRLITATLWPPAFGRAEPPGGRATAQLAPPPRLAGCTDSIPPTARTHVRLHA